TVAYWYGAPAASLVKTDELKIGNTSSEHDHQYVSPGSSKLYEITSRYEWGPDTYARDRGKIIYPQEFRSRSQPESLEVTDTNAIIAFPAQTLTARRTTTWSEFTLKLEPKKIGRAHV